MEYASSGPRQCDFLGRETFSCLGQAQLTITIGPTAAPESGNRHSSTGLCSLEIGGHLPKLHGTAQQAIQVQAYSDRPQQQRQLLPKPQRNWRCSCRVLLVTGIGHFLWTDQPRTSPEQKSASVHSPLAAAGPRRAHGGGHGTPEWTRLTTARRTAQHSHEPRHSLVSLPLLSCPDGAWWVAAASPRPPHHDSLRGGGLRGPRASAGRESVRADDSRFPPPITCARSAVGSARCAAAVPPRASASAWSRRRPGGAVQEHSPQASSAQKLPLRCFLGGSPRAAADPLDSRGPLLFLHPVGSGVDGRDRADEAPRWWLAGGPRIPRETRQSMCVLGTHGPRLGALTQQVGGRAEAGSRVGGEAACGAACVRAGYIQLETGNSWVHDCWLAAATKYSTMMILTNVWCAGKIRNRQNASVPLLEKVY